MRYYRLQFADLDADGDACVFVRFFSKYHEARAFWREQPGPLTHGLDMLTIEDDLFPGESHTIRIGKVIKPDMEWTTKVLKAHKHKSS